MHALDILQYDALANCVESSGQSSPVDYPCFAHNFMETAKLELEAMADLSQNLTLDSAGPSEPRKSDVDSYLTLSVGTTLDVQL